MAMKSIPHDLAVELGKLQIPKPPTGPTPVLILIAWAEKVRAMVPPEIWDRLAKARLGQDTQEPNA